MYRALALDDVLLRKSPSVERSAQRSPLGRAGGENGRTCARARLALEAGAGGLRTPGRALQAHRRARRTRRVRARVCVCVSRRVEVAAIEVGNPGRPL